MELIGQHPCPEQAIGPVKVWFAGRHDHDGLIDIRIETTEPTRTKLTSGPPE
jgi:hypothetical protein